MNVRRLLSVVVLLAVGIVLGRSIGAADGADKKSDESLALRCAKAQLRLAELNLKKAEDMNKKVPGTLIGGMVMQFSEDVDLAKVLVSNADKAPIGDSFHAMLERAQLNVKSAAARSARGEETRQKAPSVVSANDIERLKLATEIAQLQLERGRALVDAAPEAKLQWQFEMMADEISKLKQHTALLGQNRIGQF
jgi:hypothetical protein